MNTNNRQLELQKVKDSFNNIDTQPLKTETETNMNRIEHLHANLHTNNPNTSNLSTSNSNTSSPNTSNLTTGNSNNTLLHNTILRKTIKTRKYLLGKKRNTRKVSVLINNNDARSEIKSKQKELKNETILEIKNRLKQKNLLKNGSLAPSDVLRTTYEQCNLAGKVKNKSNDILLHNYVNS